ncbi:uncharacterized protein GIQ15_01611 [Arthroderma uncinatum]|uniref:uncharacterized protein n=1 Tax=Arthroderma uncinatum TaxID=74035 RepID=UPI00144AD99D|nr:uncharacterized protein GIQ15_01611 [Arthroderma uncinatum]KAF3492094.1 hypothetical protein GIQ15_01611 [Arthroderma uncinatum]
MSRRMQRRRDSSGEGSSGSDSEASTALFSPSSASGSDANSNTGSDTDLTSPYLSDRSDDKGAPSKKTGKSTKAVRRPVCGDGVSRRRAVRPARTVHRERAPGNRAPRKPPTEPGSDTESEDPDDNTDDELSSNDGDGYADSTIKQIKRAEGM